MLHQPQSGQLRVPFVRRCQLETLSGRVEVIVCNLSIEGAYAAVEPIPLIGDVVQLSFPLPGSELPVRVEAEVCWRNSTQHHKVHGLPPGCGLRFLNLSPTDQERIDAFVQSYREPGPPRPEWL